MPFVFAVSKAKNGMVGLSTATEVSSAKKTETSEKNNESNSVALAYDSMHLDKLGLSEQAFEYAMKGFSYLLKQGRIAKDNIISIADFSLPSSRKRLFVIDLDNYRVLYNTYVAHGVNSGKEYARQFSNKPSSYQSSLGFYETLHTYMGEHGYSLRLDGLEKGINDNANSRDIVIHAADYVNESFIRSQGYIGRSWGCPALPEKLHKPIIDKIVSFPIIRPIEFIVNNTFINFKFYNYEKAIFRKPDCGCHQETGIRDT
ncbi:MAG: murein L,D-transpeptidase catalytic domain family protein, partial [Ferruginibacter sp.]|nr:murein L,D-transpeptidase catalytic domain family protein [Ferruginibacter sp.]